MAISKKTGKKSVAQNDFLIPLPPGPPTATDVGTNRPFDNAAAVISFDTPTTNPPTASYTVFSQSDDDATTRTASGSSSPIVITGLKSDILYKFYVVGYTAEGVASDPSPLSTNTLVTSVPQTPFAPTVTSAAKPNLDVPEGTPNTSVDSVSWAAPLSGGKLITDYYWQCSDGKSGGPTSNTFVNVDQESGTVQTYRVRAVNANGTSEFSPNSASITSTFAFTPFRAFTFSPFSAFSFAPFSAFAFAPFQAFTFTPFRAFAFSPFGAFSFTPFQAFTFVPFRAFAFSPFGAFGFSPFGAFGFSPFGAFGFSPFRAFGFSPFRAFGFAPFRAFGFTPARCIAADTKIIVVKKDEQLRDEYDFIPAKDIKPGDVVLSPMWDLLKPTDNPYSGKVSYSNLSGMSLGSSIVTESIHSQKETVIINNDRGMKYSLTQPILTRRGDNISWEFAGDITINDLIWTYSMEEDCYTEVEVTELEYPGKDDVYQISVDGLDTFIAGGVFCHNK